VINESVTFQSDSLILWTILGPSFSLFLHLETLIFTFNLLILYVTLLSLLIKVLHIKCTFRLRFSSSNSHFGRFVSSFSILQHENRYYWKTTLIFNTNLSRVVTWHTTRICMNHQSGSMTIRTNRIFPSRDSPILSKDMRVHTRARARAHW